MTGYIYDTSVLSALLDDAHQRHADIARAVASLPGEASHFVSAVSLTYVSLPQRLIVVHPGDLGWALAQANSNDWILLASSGAQPVDPIALGEKVARPLFILEGRITERLGLTVAPVIVAQVGQKLELTEFAVDRRKPDETPKPAREADD